MEIPLLLCRGVAVSCVMCSLLSVFCMQFYLVYHARYERREEVPVQDESDWDA